MRAHRTALLCLAAALTMVSDGGLRAENVRSRPLTNIGMSRPPNVPDGPSRGGGGYPGGGHRGPGWGGVVPGIIVGLPQGYPTGPYIVDDGPSGPRRTQANRRGQAARRQRMSAGSCPMKSSSSFPIQSAHNRSMRCNAGTG